MVGLLAAKGAAVQAPLILPLPIATGIFAYFRSQRFSRAGLYLPLDQASCARE